VLAALLADGGGILDTHSIGGVFQQVGPQLSFPSL